MTHLSKNRAKILFIQSALLIIISVTAIFSGCRKKMSPPNREKEELSKLKSRLKSYDFKGETPQILASLDNLSNRTQGETAIQAYYFAARGYLDWFMFSWSSRNEWLLSRLFQSLQLPEKCRKKSNIDSKKYFRGKSLVMSSSCIKSLAKALKSRFSLMSKAEGSSGAYVDLADRAKTLISWLTSPDKDPALYSAIYKLLKTRGPVGTRTRLALMIQNEKMFETLPEHSQRSAAFVLARALPFQCPEVFKKILSIASPSSLYSLLNKAECGHSCDSLKNITSPHELAKKAQIACDFRNLGYHRREEIIYHTVHSSVAIRSLEALARISRGINEELSDPIIKIHTGFVQRQVKKIQDLRVPIPLPGALKIESKWIVLPRVKDSTDAPSPPPNALLVAVIFSSGLRLSTRPVAGLYDKDPRIINFIEGIPLPGKPFSPGPSDTASLLKGLRKAKAEASKSLNYRKNQQKSNDITIFMNGDSPAKLLSKQAHRLQKANLKKLGIAYISSNKISPSVVSAQIATPPRDSISFEKAVSLLERKKSATLKDGALKKEDLVKTASLSVVFSPKEDETLTQAMKRLLSYKKLDPKGKIYWAVK